MLSEIVDRAAELATSPETPASIALLMLIVLSLSFWMFVRGSASEEAGQRVVGVGGDAGHRTQRNLLVADVQDRLTLDLLDRGDDAADRLRVGRGPRRSDYLADQVGRLAHPALLAD